MKSETDMWLTLNDCAILCSVVVGVCWWHIMVDWCQ